MNTKRLLANLLSVIIGFMSLAIAFPPDETPHPLFEDTTVLWAVIGIALLLIIVLGAFGHLIGWGLWFTVLGIIMFDVLVIASGIPLLIAGLAGQGVHDPYLASEDD